MDQRPAFLPSYKREYLVDRSFQLRYTAVFASLGAAVGLVGGLVLYWVFRTGLDELNLSPEATASLRESDGAFFGAVVGVSLLLAGILGAVALLLTHRVAGPIYVMTRYVAVLAEGHFPKMRKLRRSDEFRELFELFQKSVEYIRTREMADAYKLEEALVRLTPLANSSETRAALDALKAIRDRKRTMAERADFDGPLVFSAHTQASDLLQVNPKNLPS